MDQGNGGVLTDSHVSKEREHELVFAVVIKHFGEPNKLRYKVARRLAKTIKLHFGDGTEVHIGTRDGNLVKWTEEEWPKGGDD